MSNNDGDAKRQILSAIAENAMRYARNGDKMKSLQELADQQEQEKAQQLLPAEAYRLRPGFSPYNQHAMMEGIQQEYQRIRAMYRNEALEWAAQWVESQATGAEERVVEFAQNVAMSIRAAKEQGHVE